MVWEPGPGGNTWVCVRCGGGTGAPVVIEAAPKTDGLMFEEGV